MRLFLLFLTLAGFLVLSCSREGVSDDTAYRLGFSVDTVQFDTIFTTLGSATKRLTVYNPNKRAVRTSVTLAGGQASPFRINIDGLDAENAAGVEIAAEDSMYIFVEVTIDPQNSDLPVMINDSILFGTNTNGQCICLEAHGQDVFILRNETIGNTAWTGTKPYLVYGRLTVDTLETLHIDAGVHVYLHRDADIYVKGSLVARGEADNPVIFSGNRLEQMYRNIPGQWGSIVFGTESRDNVLRHVEIRNGTNGIVFGNPGYTQVPAIGLYAVIIANMSNAGLSVFASDVEAVNCLIVNCSSHAVGLFCGGISRFIHCTIANNYSPYISRKDVEALTINHSYSGEESGIEGKIPGNIFFGNSIVYGTMNDEISADEATTFLFDHCLLRTTKDTSAPPYLSVLTDAPAFAGPARGDFRLKKDSPATDAADATLDVEIPADLDGKNRITGPAPDMGAYEWEPED